MFDPVQEILSFNAGRDPERLTLKYRNMRQSPFIFLRATCHLFYRRLPELPESPAVWCCGDLHLQNFGSYKGDNRQVYFDLNDFDEAALAPASWDLLRMLTSILVGAKDMDLDGEAAKTLCEDFLDAYRGVLVSGKAGWVEREIAEGLLRDLLDSLRGRLRPEFLDGRVEGKGKKRRLRLDNGKALPAAKAQRDSVEKLVGELGEALDEKHFFEVLDVARRIAGNGSLGVDRFVILVRGKGSPDGNYLLDLKEALPSSMLTRLAPPQPAWKNEAERVVAVQRRMQAVSQAFLRPLCFDKRAYILRELQPTEDRVTLDASQGGFKPIRGVIRSMAGIVASAQLRSGGREGSAIADELVAYGTAKGSKALLRAAADCARQLRQDWASYCAAYDDGVFRL